MMDKNKWLLDQFYEHVSDNKKEKFDSLIQNRTRYITVVLENLFQPHNASAVLRSCDGFGIQDIHIIENYNKYKPNREIDMGSSKWLNTIKYKEKENNTVECIRHLKSKGYKIVATTPHENDCLIDDLPLDQPTALLFGTELTGLTKEALNEADAFVKIPMFGFTESFNISVSVALALYSVTQKMRKDNAINWQLSEEEKTDIRLNWCRKIFRNREKMEAIFLEKFEKI